MKNLFIKYKNSIFILFEFNTFKLLNNKNKIKIKQ